ncbi:unnamed protein product [Cunninghamella echinulata]
MTSQIFSSILTNVTESLTLTVKNQGDCYATFEGQSGKLVININIFDAPLIYFALVNIKRNSFWQIKGDQIVRMNSIDNYTFASFTLTCKSISPVPYLDTNGNWVAHNITTHRHSILSSLLSLASTGAHSQPIGRRPSFSSSSSFSSKIPLSTSRSSSSILPFHSLNPPPLTSISRDDVPKHLDRMFIFLIYRILMNESNPLHNDFNVDWEDERLAKQNIRIKLEQFRDPDHYSYIPDDQISLIDSQYVSTSSLHSRYHLSSSPSSSSSPPSSSSSSSPSSSSSSSLRCSFINCTTTTCQHKRHHSDMNMDSSSNNNHNHHHQSNGGEERKAADNNEQ